MGIVGIKTNNSRRVFAGLSFMGTLSMLSVASAATMSLVGPSSMAGKVYDSTNVGTGTELDLIVTTDTADMAITGAATTDVIPDDTALAVGMMTPMSNWYASTNGYLVQDTATAACHTQYMNSEWMGGGCNSFTVAPFWDDLIAINGTSSITWGRTLSAAAAGGNPAVQGLWYVQWNDFARFDSPDSRLTFRATMYETANGFLQFVRVQLIKLEGTGSDASSATIGITRFFNNSLRQVNYSYNAAITATGTATVGKALLAIDFDLDSDRDTLLANHEARLGSVDNNLDSDNDGVTDLGEFVAGFPLDANAATTTVATDTPSLTDTDSDTLVDVDEAAWGTDVDVADTDKDNIDDGVEIFTTGTNPMMADTDGDGFLDGDEDKNQDGVYDTADGEGDPNNVDDYPGLMLAKGYNGMHRQPDMVTDAEGNIHIIADATICRKRCTSLGLQYWMIKADGTVAISRSVLPIPNTGANSRPRWPKIGVHGTEVVVVYAQLDGHSSWTVASRLGYLRFDIASSPKDGTPLAVKRLPVATQIEVEGTVYELDMALDSAGVAHIVLEDNAGDTDRDGSPSARLVRYVAIAADATVKYQSLISSQSRFDQGSGNDIGLHKIQSPHIAIDSDDVAHIVWSLKVAPNRTGQGSSYARYPHGTFYSRVEGGSAGTPVYLGPGYLERSALAVHNGLLYISGGSGEIYDDPSRGVVFATIATSSLQAGSVVSRTGDLFGVTTQAPSSAYIANFVSAYSDNDYVVGAGMAIMPNGNAQLAFISKSNSSRMILATVSPQGELLKTRYQFSVAGASTYRKDKYRSLVPFNGGLALLYTRDSTGNLKLVQFPAAAVVSPNPPELVFPPSIASGFPQVAIATGNMFSFAFSATDDVSASDALTWSLSVAPTGMTISDAGVLAWTPGSGQVGASLITVKVCDEAGACTEVDYTLNVLVAGGGLNPPMIAGVSGSTAYAQGIYESILTVTDADLPGDRFTFALTAPAPLLGDMAVSDGGVISWNPTNDDIGSHSIHVEVTDAAGLTDTFVYTLAVLPTIEGAAGANHAPRFNSTPVTTAYIGKMYSYAARILDANSADTHTFELLTPASAPGDMAISADGVLSWNPVKADIGALGVALKVTDSSGLSSVQSFVVTVFSGDVLTGGRPISVADSGCMGCASTGDNGAAWMLLMMFVALRIRRRRSLVTLAK